MTWEEMPPLTEQQAGLRSGCLTCGPQPITAAMTSWIAVGFGSAGVTKDGLEIWSEGSSDDAAEITFADAERWAAEDPDHDWRVFFHGPLSDSVYQRHAPDQWVLIEKGEGFA